MVITQPIVGDEAAVIHPAQNGGTRHLSAAQFVYDQRDTLALVASQDGRFTIFAWSPVKTWSTPIASTRCCCKFSVLSRSG